MVPAAPRADPGSMNDYRLPPPPPPPPAGRPGWAPPPPWAQAPPPPTPPAPPRHDDPSGSDPRPPRRDRPIDRSRAGATWVTATGAFLVLAAASVFVAVQWDHIPDALKLAALGLICGGCLLAGRALRGPLPATSRVLYHLGAFLIPVVSAAVALHAGVSWATMTLVEGLVGTAAFWALDRVERSVVLDWATTAAAVVAAVGVGATTPLPTPLVLAGLAVGASLTGPARRAISWALAAGVGPLVAAAAAAVRLGPGVMARLGLTGSEPRLAAVATGIAAAVVLGREADRRHDLLLVVLAALSALVGLADGWGVVVHGWSGDLIGAAAIFLGAEVVAWALVKDPFWGRPARALAVTTEAVAAWALGPLSLTGLVRLADHWRHTTPAPWWTTLGVAGGLALVAWFVADLRRREPDRTPLGIALLVGSGWLPATLALAATATATVAAATASAPLTGLAAVMVAGLVVLSGRPGGAPVAIVLTVPAAMSAPSHPVWCAALGLAGALVLAAATVVRAPLARHGSEIEATWMLAVSTVLPVLAAAMATAGRVAPLTAAIGAVLILWAVGLVLDIAEIDPRLTGLGAVPRGAALLVLVTVPLLHPAGVCALTALLVGLSLADAVARPRPWMGVVAGILTPLAVGSGAVALGASRGWAALATMAVAGLATLADEVAPPAGQWVLRAATASSALVALALAGPDRAVLATLMIAIGGLGIVWAARLDQLDLGLVGGLLATGGIWLHLVDHHVQASEAYLAPVALVMVVAGAQARRRVELSSWVAYGPGIALLGVSALAERMAGGGSVHALVAGGVGLTAVMVGGQRRLAAPLFLGTGLLVAVAAHETLAVTAGVPTWGWLAIGGVTLIGAGIAMERAERTPLETGRRVVDVVSERFS
jgi:hypothetical protein